MPYWMRDNKAIHLSDWQKTVLLPGAQLDYEPQSIVRGDFDFSVMNVGSSAAYLSPNQLSVIRSFEDWFKYRMEFVQNTIDPPTGFGRAARHCASAGKCSQLQMEVCCFCRTFNVTIDTL
jgi:hypothetical protein